jgi:hypothetical protein
MSSSLVPVAARVACRYAHYSVMFSTCKAHFFACSRLILALSYLPMNLETHVFDLRTRLRAAHVSQREIARRAGPDISFSWVAKFATGALKNPSVASLLALERTLDALEPSKAA